MPTPQTNQATPSGNSSRQETEDRAIVCALSHLVVWLKFLWRYDAELLVHS